MHTRAGRLWAIVVGWTVVLVTAMAVSAGAVLAADSTDGSSDGSTEEQPAVGRFSILSEAGGAVWTFQPGGALFVVGPGDLTAEGSWMPAVEHGQFDAGLSVAITGQVLSILGTVSPDGDQVALYVAAGEAAAPLDGTPWPPISRLVGERVGMVPTESPNPTPMPDGCLRPVWGAAGEIDWERCEDVVVIPSVEPSLAPGA